MKAAFARPDRKTNDGERRRNDAPSTREIKNRRPNEIKLLLNRQRPCVREILRKDDGPSRPVSLDVLRISRGLKKTPEIGRARENRRCDRDDYKCKMIKRADPQPPSDVKCSEKTGSIVIFENDVGDQIPREDQEKIDPGPSSRDPIGLEVIQHDQQASESAKRVELGDTIRRGNRRVDCCWAIDPRRNGRFPRSIPAFILVRHRSVLAILRVQPSRFACFVKRNIDDPTTISPASGTIKIG